MQVIEYIREKNKKNISCNLSVFVLERGLPHNGANLSVINYITGNFPVSRWTRGFRPAQTAMLLLAIIREQITAVKQNMYINRLFLAGICKLF